MEFMEFWKLVCHEAESVLPLFEGEQVAVGPRCLGPSAKFHLCQEYHIL
jgi:hypothetical protein